MRSQPSTNRGACGPCCAAKPQQTCQLSTAPHIASYICSAEASQLAEPQSLAHLDGREQAAALVVVRTPPPHLAVPDHRLEGRAVPELQRVSGLHIIVACTAGRPGQERQQDWARAARAVWLLDGQQTVPQPQPRTASTLPHTLLPTSLPPHPRTVNEHRGGAGAGVEVVRIDHRARAFRAEHLHVLQPGTEASPSAPCSEAAAVLKEECSVRTSNPARSSRARSHSAARSMSPARAGSADTEGMAVKLISSAGPDQQVCSPPRLADRRARSNEQAPAHVVGLAHPGGTSAYSPRCTPVHAAAVLPGQPHKQC